jgi:segregation and condensation protein A
MVKIGLFELIDAFQKIFEKLSPAHLVDLTADRLSVKERISELIDILKKQKSLTFDELFATDSTKEEIIVTFLAILEMVKLSLVRLAQHVQTGIIRLFYAG